jgi:hypothetical protein
LPAGERPSPQGEGVLSESEGLAALPESLTPKPKMGKAKARCCGSKEPNPDRMSQAVTKNKSESKSATEAELLLARRGVATASGRIEKLSP